MKRTELRDEFYMQLLKQSRGNTTASAIRAWELFLLVASSMPPTKDFVGLVSEYVHTVSHTDTEENPAVKALAVRTWMALKRSAKAGSRRSVLLFSEHILLQKNVLLLGKIGFKIMGGREQSLRPAS